MNTPNYQSRQWLVLLWLFLPMLTVGMALFDARHTDLTQLPQAMAILVLVNLMVLALFGHLKIQLSGTELMWTYGVLAWPKWKLPMQEIERVEVCQTAWFEGKGIRFTREGMLYNAAGNGAVRVYKKDGTRLRIGSAEPELFCAKLQEAITQSTNQALQLDEHGMVHHG